MPVVAAALPGILLNLAVGVAVNAAVGLVSNAITGSADASRDSRGAELDPRAGVNQPVRVIFGEWATGGRLWHQNSYGDDNEYLQLVFECGRTEYEAMTGLLKDGKACTLSGSNSDARGRVINELKKGSTPHGWVKYYTGAAGQTADPELVARANPSGRWPSTKKMTGTAYAIVTLRFDEEVFESGLPQFAFVWRGAKLYDRRKDSTQPGGSGTHRWGQPETYEWTRNPAVILDNYRRGLWINGVRVLGTGVGAAACHHARFVAAANLCDEPVIYEDTGRELPRYTFNGEVSDAEDQISVVKMLETAMAGYGSEFGGAYAPLPAQTMSSVLTLYDHDRVADEDVSERTQLDPTEVKNAFNGVFVSPADGWVEKEYGLRNDPSVETVEGGRRQGKLDLEFVTDQETAGAVAEIFRRRDRYSATEVATYGPKAAKLEVGDVITRVSDLLGTVRMMVWGIKELPGARYRLTLRRWDNAIVPDPSEGFLPILPDPIAAPVPARPITVSGLLALAATQTSGPNTVPAIRVTWTPITDSTVDRVIIKYWRDGEPDDARYLSVEEPGAGIAVIEGVVPEADYVVSATIATTPPRTTIWSTEASVTTGPLTVTTVPGPASVDLGALGEDVKAALQWMSSGVRTLRDTLTRLGTILEEADLDNYYQREQLRREIGVRLDDVEASFTEVIEVALGPGGAIATALSSLYAALGGNDAQVNVRWQAVAAPTGYSARYAVEAAVNDGTFRAATFMLDVPANPALPTRIVLDAGQTVISTDGGTTVQAVFDEDGAVIRDLTVGTIRSADGQSYWNLTTGAFRISGGKLMARWAFMVDPVTQNIGLYDEPVASGDPTDPNSARNAPLNDPEGQLASLYWHILLDNMEVLFDTSVTVSHAATSAGGSTSDSGAQQSAAFDVDDTTADHDVYTHSAGYEPFVLAAIGDNILVPGYPVQVPVSANGAARYVTVYVTSTKVFLREYRTRGASGLSALSQSYRLLGFRRQRSAEGNDPPRLADFDPDTGVLKLGDGRWANNRRYLQVVPGGSPLALPFGRTLDLDAGAFRLALSDGTTFDPLPNTIKQGIHATGGTFASDPVSYGSPYFYGGSWTPGEILEVQAP